MSRINQIYRTPTKNSTWQQTVHQTQAKHGQSIFSQKQYSIKIDYKAKTFSLIKKITEHELYQRKQTQLIIQLQRQKQASQNSIREALLAVNARSLQQMVEMIKQGVKNERESRFDSRVHDQLTNIIAEYKKILQKQQIKSIKAEQQNKKYQIKMQKIEGLLGQREAEIHQLKKELQNIRKQFRQLLTQNSQLKELKQQIQNKYHDQIMHFEGLEAQVQQKLKVVEEQMRFYQEQRQQNNKKIQMLKRELEIRKIKEYFSFGGVQTKKVQTEQQWGHKTRQNQRTQQNYQTIRQNQNSVDFTEIRGDQKDAKYCTQDNQQNMLSIQCFEASIKTLLQENQRLKNALLSLYKNKGQQLPKQTELEIKILLSTAVNQT